MGLREYERIERGKRRDMLFGWNAVGREGIDGRRENVEAGLVACTGDFVDDMEGDV